MHLMPVLCANVGAKTVHTTLVNKHPPTKNAKNRNPLEKDMQQKKLYKEQSMVPWIVYKNGRMLTGAQYTPLAKHHDSHVLDMSD